MLGGLFDELGKIAEVKKKPDSGRFKKFLKNTAIISAGTGAGVGAAELAQKALEKAFAGRWAGIPSPTKRRLLGAALGLASSGAFVAREWNAHERREASK